MTSSPRTISDRERRARLALRQRLHPDTRADDVAAIADELVAIHSTDNPTVYLSLLARMEHPALDAVGGALHDRRSLVRHHAMRRTLWVATPATMCRLHATSTRKIAAVERRRTVSMLEASGIDDGDAWLDAAGVEVVAAIRELGPMTARELGRAVPRLTHRLVLSPGKSYEATQGAHSRVLSGLGFEGALVRTHAASIASGEYTWAVTEDWLGGPIDDGRELAPAAAEILDAWLRAFGPATEDDVVWWTGWTKTQTRAALADCDAVPVRLEDGTPAVVASGDEAPAEDPGPWVALLPGLDVTTMGWKRRRWYLPEYADVTFDSAGNGGATIWVDGRVVGAWAQPRDGAGAVRVHWLTDVAAARRREVQARAEELSGWLDGRIISPRFPAPIHATLVG